MPLQCVVRGCRAAQPLLYRYKAFAGEKALSFRPQVPLGVLATLANIRCGKLGEASCAYTAGVNLAVEGGMMFLEIFLAREQQ